MTSTTDKYTSGDPSLAFVDEEAEQAPKFDDPYEERKYVKHRLSLAFRVFSNFGLAEGVAGHITVRDPVDSKSFWVNSFGRLPHQCPQSYWTAMAIYHNFPVEEHILVRDL